MPHCLEWYWVSAPGSRFGRLTVRAGAAGPHEPGRPCDVLLDDLGDSTRTNGAATLTDGEPQALFHGDGLDQRDGHLGVVTGHHHLGALGEGHHAGHVRGPEVELRPVVVEERRVPATLVLAEDVDLRLEVGVGGDRLRLADDLPALDVLALDAAQQEADVLARATLLGGLAENLGARPRPGGGLG